MLIKNYKATNTNKRLNDNDCDSIKRSKQNLYIENIIPTYLNLGPIFGRRTCLFLRETAK